MTRRARHPNPNGWEGLAVSLPVDDKLKPADGARRLYELVLESARDIILIVGAGGQILEANRAAVEAYGYSRDELLSITIDDLRTPEIRKLIPADEDHLAEAGVLFESEHRRKDGTSIPVEVSSRAALVGDEILAVNIVRDITARRRARQSLQESERRFRELFQNANDAIFLHGVSEDGSARALRRGERYGLSQAWLRPG